MAVTHGDEHAPSDDDPFADLVLDESFVSAAKVSEAPARTRDAIARYAHLEQPVFGTGRPPERAPRSRKRRCDHYHRRDHCDGAAWLHHLVDQPPQPRCLAAGATHERGPAAESRTFDCSVAAAWLEHADTGTKCSHQLAGNLADRQCLTWDLRNNAKLTPVPCSQPHRAEVTGNADIRSRFGQAYPGRRR